jgi:uncharacterized membrane protein YeiB
MSDKDFSEHQSNVTSSALAAPPPFTSVAPDQRINALDILRGFALIGILLMNIEWFGRPISGLVVLMQISQALTMGSDSLFGVLLRVNCINFLLCCLVWDLL